MIAVVTEWPVGGRLNPFYFRAFLKYRNKIIWNLEEYVSIPFISGLSLNSRLLRSKQSSRVSIPFISGLSLNTKWYALTEKSSVSIPFISGLSLNPVYKNSSFQSYSYLSYFQFFPFFHTLWFRLFPFCTVPVRMSHFFRRVAIVQGEDTPYSFPVCLSLSRFR